MAGMINRFSSQFNALLEKSQKSTALNEIKDVFTPATVDKFVRRLIEERSFTEQVQSNQALE